jgi:translation initiation factor 4A
MPSYAYDKCVGFMRNPLPFLVKNDQLTLDGIQQYHVNVGVASGKLDTMDELFPFLKEARGITFCNTRQRADKLTRELQDRGHVNLSEMVCRVLQR